MTPHTGSLGLGMVYFFSFTGLLLLLMCATPVSAQTAYDQLSYTFSAQNHGAFNPANLSPPAFGGGNLQNGLIMDDPLMPGNKVLRVRFPEGKVGPSQGSGMSFSQALTPATSYWLSYRVRFESDYGWRAGGKLLGLTGGDAPTGGQVADGDGWSARQMWFSNGRLGPYIYHMDQPGNWGDTLGGTGHLGAQARFVRGQWHHVTQYVQLNTGNNNDGRLMLFLDGVLLTDRTDMRYRNQNRAPINRFYLNLFFGGSSDDYRPLKDEYLFLDDIRVSRNVDYVFETRPGGTPQAALIPEPLTFTLLAAMGGSLLLHRPATRK